MNIEVRARHMGLASQAGGHRRITVRNHPLRWLEIALAIPLAQFVAATAWAQPGPECPFSWSLYCFPNGSCDSCCGLGCLSLLYEGGMYSGALCGPVTPPCPCSADMCPPVDPSEVGACCLPDGQCTLWFSVNVNWCTAQGGVFLGGGTDCSPPPCDFDGACCLSDGECISGVTAVDCGAQGGHFRGPGTNCGPNPCDGACCMGDGACVVTSAADCAALGGTFVGNDSNCISSECPTCCIADLNCDGQANGLDVGPFVLALLDPAAYSAAFPNCNSSFADVNDDGLINVDDVQAFVIVLLAP